MLYDVIIAGAGPAGLLAAWQAARQGARVLLLEKNAQAGRKLLLTGAGRCNLANQDPPADFVNSFYGKGRFLYPAIQQFYWPELLGFLAAQGISCLADDQGRYHPVSQKAGDVLAALLAACRSAGVIIEFNEPVLSIEKEETDQTFRLTGVRSASGFYPCQAFILACGGSSYPWTGSNGDGCRLAAAAGHKITDLRPGLVALDCQDNWVSDLSGISLADTSLALRCQGRQLATARGSILFTHQGLSGPPVLSLSRHYEPDRAGCNWQLELNLLPGQSLDQLYALLAHGCSSQPDLKLQNLLASSLDLPRRLAGALLDLTGGKIDQLNYQTSLKQLRQLLRLMQKLPLAISGSRGFAQAMVTVGGLDLAQIDPRTMMSRLVTGFYAAGEVLDLDGDSGGYNLQAAFSTGWLAGKSAARQASFTRDF